MKTTLSSPHRCPRQESIEGDHNPSNKSTRSNTILPRAPTFSQTLQIITSRFKLSASPKLRRTRKRPLHERTIEDTHELSDNDGNYEETIPQIVEDPSETEIFFKQSITTSQVYQLDQKLDDTIPYLDPLLDSPSRFAYCSEPTRHETPLTVS